MRQGRQSEFDTVSSDPILEADPLPANSMTYAHTHPIGYGQTHF